MFDFNTVDTLRRGKAMNNRSKELSVQKSTTSEAPSNLIQSRLKSHRPHPTSAIKYEYWHNEQCDHHEINTELSAHYTNIYTKHCIMLDSKIKNLPRAGFYPTKTLNLGYDWN